MSNTRISVVMATFNGIKYIREQLDSIRTQTLPPDEVIICDDCSSDGTFEFCGEYISQHDLTGWRVFRNDQNMGFAKNFRHALSLSQGDVVFTADQDDIWMPDKLQAMTRVMQENSGIMLLASNYIAFRDNDGSIINAHMKNLDRNDGEIIRLRLEDSWLESLRPGCTYAFRKELLSRKAEFLTKRSKILGTKNIPAITLFVIKNIKYYPTMRNALSDIYAAIFLR